MQANPMVPPFYGREVSGANNFGNELRGKEGGG